MQTLARGVIGPINVDANFDSVLDEIIKDVETKKESHWVHGLANKADDEKNEIVENLAERFSMYFE